jgi:prolyl oligopeptidase
MKALFCFLISIAIFQNYIFSKEPVDVKHWNYPVINADTAIDYYYGKKVIDPFRNIENIDDSIVKLWMHEQNKLYDTIIHSISYRDSLYKKMQGMKEKRKQWTDFIRSTENRIFFATGYYLDDNDIERLVYTDSINQKPIELFNTKEFNERDKCTYSINYYEPSADGKYIAFGISPNGNEMATIYIIDVEKKQLLPDRIDRCFMANIQWLTDNSGFFYMQEKEIETEEDRMTGFEDSKARFHILNSNAKNDKFVFSRLFGNKVPIGKPDAPFVFINPSTNKVLLNISKGSYRRVYYTTLIDVLTQEGKLINWIEIGNDDMITNSVLFGDKYFALSYKNNPNGQIIYKNLRDTAQLILFDANGFRIDDMALTKNKLYVTSFENGASKLFMIDLCNFKKERIDLPFSGSINLNPNNKLPSSYHNTDILWFSLEGYDHQWGIYTCDTSNNVNRTKIAPEIKYFNTGLELVVEEIEVPSHDGTMIPLSIIYNKGIKLDGKNPTIINAYGAYGISLRPDFYRNRLLWYTNGGIYAVAHVRGGGEKGDHWYKGGFKATKPNSWKDLIACAEYMIKNKYTSPQKLAITGASAGGITVGRAIIDRPDLFKAAVIYVGCFNTLRAETSHINSIVREFGTVKDSLESQYLYIMDAYQNTKDGVKYPSILFTAGMNDGRVDPWQPAKEAARMQQLNKGDNIVLLRIEDKGHFDYPSDADVYSFLFWQLGHPDFKLKEQKGFYKPNHKN